MAEEKNQKNQGMVRVIAWNGKKQIYDYVKRSLLEFWISQGYVICLAEDQKER